MVLIKKLFLFLFKGDLPQQSAPDIEEAVEVREKEDYKLSKDENSERQIVKLVKHNNDKLLKLLKRYAKDKP
jgi:transcription termination factor NusB